MDAVDLFRVAIRYAHVMAAVLWVGGNLFYALTLRPAFAVAQRSGGAAPGAVAELSAAIGREFSARVKLATAVFLFTGAILTFDRLSQPRVTWQYVALLGLKIALALWMFWLARRLGRPRSHAAQAQPPAGRPGRWTAWLAPATSVRPQTLVLWLGLAVYLLAVLLKVLYEATLLAA